MKQVTVILLSIFLFPFWAIVQAQTSETPDLVNLIDGQNKYSLGEYMYLLEDPSGDLTIEDVMSPEFKTRFTPSPGKAPNFGYTDSAYWIRLHLKNETQATNHWLLEVNFANTHFVDLYTILEDGQSYIIKQSGVLRPPDTRDLLYPHIIFHMTIPVQEPQTIFLRVQNGASMTLPMTLWEPSAFSSAELYIQVEHGVFFGLLLGLLAYNLFLLFSVREKSYFYLVFFLTTMIFFEATYTGYTDIYLPELYDLKPLYLPFIFGLLIASILLFTNAFLDTKTNSSKLYWLNMGVLGVLFAIIILSPINSYHINALLLITWSLLVLVLTILAGIVSWRSGFHPARIFIIAWLGLPLAFLITILARLGIFESTNITENAYRIGVMWMAVGWSIALADRINVLKAETDVANRSLRASEDRLTQTLEAMPVGVVVYNPDQKPTYINKRTAEILSNPKRSIGPDPDFGRTLADAIAYYSFRKSGSDQLYSLQEFPVFRALKGEASTADDIEADLIDWQIALEVWASPVIDKEGNIESAVVAFQDISTRKQQDAELEQYRQNLEKLVQERTDELNAINERLMNEVAEREILELFLNKRIRWMTSTSIMRQKITGAADLPWAFEELSDLMLDLLGAESVFIFRLDDREDPDEFICRLNYEGTPPDSQSVYLALKRDTKLRREIENGEIVIYGHEEAAALPEPLQDCLTGNESRSLMFVPMKDSGSVEGVLGLLLPEHVQNLTPLQKELIPKMAFDLLSLTQYAAYLDQARILVAADERNRLARDLHDSVTQVLFSASLVAEVLPQIIRRDPDKALQSLEELRRLTRGALAEMRTMLLELRPLAITKYPLAELLAQLTEASTTRNELPSRLFIEKIPPLPLDVHTSFYRIAQEALNNITKHARATQVTISLNSLPVFREQNGLQELEVRLVIEDDGVGFSTADRKVENLGLGIMRERASDVHADLSIDSQIGKGTRVTLVWCGTLENKL